MQSLEPNGAAAETGFIEKGDYIIGLGNQSMIAQDFDFVLTVILTFKNCMCSINSLIESSEARDEIQLYVLQRNQGAASWRGL